MTSSEKLVNGARRVAAQGDDPEPSPGFYANSNIQDPSIGPQSLSTWAALDGFQVSVQDFTTQDTEHAFIQKLNAWFTAKEEASVRRPIYAGALKRGVVPDDQPDQDEAPKADLASFKKDKR